MMAQNGLNCEVPCLLWGEVEDRSPFAPDELTGVPRASRSPSTELVLSPVEVLRTFGAAKGQLEWTGS